MIRFMCTCTLTETICTCTCESCVYVHVHVPVYFMQGLPTKSVSMDNFSLRSSTGSAGLSSAAGEIDSKELNGVNNRSFSDSSGLNCTPKSGSLSSFDDRERQCEHSKGRGGEEREMGNEKDIEQKNSVASGNMVLIPQFPAHTDGNRGQQ